MISGRLICLLFIGKSIGSPPISLNSIWILVFVNEELNQVADRALETAMTYISKTPSLGVKVDIQRVVGNRTDAKGILESCK